LYYISGPTLDDIGDGDMDTSPPDHPPSDTGPGPSHHDGGRRRRKRTKEQVDPP